MNCMVVNRSKQMGESMMHTAKMTCDVISLGAGGSAILPFASETKIVGALPANMFIAKMIIKSFRVDKGGGAVKPETVVGDCGI